MILLKYEVMFGLRVSLKACKVLREGKMRMRGIIWMAVQLDRYRNCKS